MKRNNKMVDVQSMFDDEEGYERFKKKMYDDLSDTIRRRVAIVKEKTVDFIFYSEAILEFDLFGVYECVHKHLLKCTKNEEWSEKIASDLSDGVESMILTLNNHYKVDEERMGDMIYEYVTYRLDDGKCPCILVP